MSAAALVSNAINPNESGPEGIFMKKEDDQEEPGIPLALPFHTETLISKPLPERPHLILPDAWLVTGYSERVGEDGSSSKICFGMITNLRFKSLNEISAQLNLNSKDPKVRLSPDDKLFRLDATHEVELGEVQPRTAEILRALSVPDISLQLFTAPKRTQKEWVRTQAKRKTRTETFVSLSLIIYGSMELCESVGEFASECDIDLQDPTRPVRNVLYKNPHLLMEPEEPLVWTSTILNSTIVQEIDTVVSQEFLTTLLSAGFLPENDVLEPTEDPEQIRTQLMRHQKEGLTFLLQREKGSSFDANDMHPWFRKLHTNDIVSYVNTITGSQQNAAPPFFRGGLLADEMGLGKTLQLISLIASDKSISSSSLESKDPTSLHKSAATLVVVPSTIFFQEWSEQIDRHTHTGTMTWGIFHGQKRPPITQYFQYDIVITTYHTLVSEWKNLHRNAREHDLGPSPYTVFWHRIVLDEAHIIRNGGTLVARAMCKLHADRRWLLTSTPVQNSLEDLAPIFQFLRAYPFDNKKTFMAEITRPLMTRQGGGLGRLKALMGAITLRRTKQLLQPSSQRMIRTLVFNPAEKRAYDAAIVEAREGINTAISNQGTISVMQSLTKLRQMCNHGLQELKTKTNVAQLTQSWNSGTAQEAFLAMLDNDTADCSECGQDLRQISAEEMHSSHYHELFKCLHLKCDQCLAKVSGGEKENKGCPHDPKCQSHQVRHRPSDTLPTARSRQDSPNGLDLDKISTKIKVLADDIGRDGRGEKSVVFSCWSKTLDLIERYLAHAAIRFVRLDGSISERDRYTRLNRFNYETDIEVLLMSYTIMIGADLTAASQVYLMEPQWNEVIEEQAISRVIRLGQTKYVKVIRYCMKNSIEQHVMYRQLRRMELRNAALPVEGGIDNIKTLRDMLL